jgi:hypothetical protein
VNGPFNERPKRPIVVFADEERVAARTNLGASKQWTSNQSGVQTVRLKASSPAESLGPIIA